MVIIAARVVTSRGLVCYFMGLMFVYLLFICDVLLRLYCEMLVYNVFGLVLLRCNSVISYFNALFAGIVAYGDRVVVDLNFNLGGILNVFVLLMCMLCMFKCKFLGILGIGVFEFRLTIIGFVVAGVMFIEFMFEEFVVYICLFRVVLNIVLLFVSVFLYLINIKFLFVVFLVLNFVMLCIIFIDVLFVKVVWCFSVVVMDGVNSKYVWWVMLLMVLFEFWVCVLVYVMWCRGVIAMGGVCAMGVMGWGVRCLKMYVWLIRIIIVCCCLKLWMGLFCFLLIVF